jgi:hypothetical protein
MTPYAVNAAKPFEIHTIPINNSRIIGALFLNERIPEETKQKTIAGRTKTSTSLKMVLNVYNIAIVFGLKNDPNNKENSITRTS